jgi:hypothetical protein
MFFQGLVRNLGSVNTSAYTNTLTDIVRINLQPNFKFPISLFNDSQWGIIEVAYRDISEQKNFIPINSEYENIKQHILNYYNNDFYVVQSMLAWLPPGTSVSKHIDLQKIYTETIRVHVQIMQNTESYMSMWRGDQEIKFNMPIGSVYELNNRVYHAAINNSTSSFYCILIFDISLKNVKFNAQDNIIKIPACENTKNLPIGCNYTI